MSDASRSKFYTITLAFVLLSVIIIGLSWLAVGAELVVGAALVFAAGLSMIFLPCTLPLVFIIVPLTAGKGVKKGLGMAALFGLGLTITLMLYGIGVAFVGQYFGLDKITRIMLFVAGIAAYLFGLIQLKMLKIKLPELPARIPERITKKGDYIKSLFFGLLLGNAGVGCPNPAFYVMLIFIANLGDLGTGAWLGFVHGLGRAVPLLFLATLGIIGISLSKKVAKLAPKVDRWSGFALVFFGAFILTIGALGMHWWEDSILHEGYNNFLLDVAPNLAELEDHPVFQGVFVAPIWVGWAVLAILFTIPLYWDVLRRKKHEKAIEHHDHNH